MNLSDTTLPLGLSAIVTFSRAGRHGMQRVGRTPAVVKRPDATKIYRMVSGLKGTEEAWYVNVRTGSCSDMVVGGDSKDVEGVSIDMPTAHGVELRCTAGAVNFTVGSLWKGRLFTGDVFVLASPAGNSSIVGSLVIVPLSENSSIEVTCAGQ